MTPAHFADSGELVILYSGTSPVRQREEKEALH